MFKGKWRNMQDPNAESAAVLPRIYFCLDAEDPRKFAKRVAHAFK